MDHFFSLVLDKIKVLLLNRKNYTKGLLTQQYPDLRYSFRNKLNLMFKKNHKNYKNIDGPLNQKNMKSYGFFLLDFS